VTADDGYSFLVDTPPELREACIEHRVFKVDSVLLTHAHMDHVAAFDDVRRFNTINGTKVPCDPASPGANGRTFRILGKSMACHAMPETVEQMRRIFPYISAEGGKNGLYRPMIEFVPDDEFALGSIIARRLKVEHGFPCCGYIISDGLKRLGYISDCHDIGDDEVERLKCVDVMVLNCLREREHATHLSLSRALEYLKLISPKKAFLTHLCHDFTYAQWMAKLPSGVEPGYDGMEESL
jgi:phosphoribosyl 1,2-cyclic phosphate phosphodiesterase